MKSLRVTGALITHLIYFLLTTVFLTVPGFLLVAVAIAFERDDVSFSGWRIVNAPRWLWVWGNDEDGYNPEWYADLHPTWNWFWRSWVWAAWRNAHGNFRFWKWVHPPPAPERIQWVWLGKNGARGFVCWQGWRSCVRYKFDNGKTWTSGWRYMPRDRMGVDPSDWRLHGCGFTTRYRVMAPGDV